MRCELTDHKWTAIKPMLPNKPRGVPRATRYDKLAAKHLSFVQLASIRLWLRVYEPTLWSDARGGAWLVSRSARQAYIATTAPIICATMNGMTSAGRMPANVSDKLRARVTAGLAF